MTATTTRTSANSYGGKCRKPACGQWVEPLGGVLVGKRGAWGVEHREGECPAPKPAAAPTAPAAQPALGYYVRNDGAAVKVVESKRVQPDGSRRRYGLVFTPHAGARPSWDYVRGAGISVATLTPMTAQDAAALGLSHGHCIACCRPLGGETLSAAVSALIGYGEVCAGHNGWAYPKGVAAQRAFIASR
jgi:hypothetical protein